ncbi:conserved hypothetical protein [Thiomonas delicata]|uniref:Uncharacterized protein n=1 Tax=Thiomonas delicata TaxID=364030 RepID=A0A238CZU9_THIDL|nr:conserved hypothetical protein [Thiomonas delicata]
MGTTIGFLATRDMASPQLGNIAKDLTANTHLTGLAIGHHALRRGNNGDTQPVEHLWDGVTPAVNSKPGATDTLNALDDRTPGVILERNLQVRLGSVAQQLEAVDIALVLQHLRNGSLQLGGRHPDRSLLDKLRISNASQHIGNGITHAH